MKKLLNLFIFLTIINPIYSQNLSLDDLITLQKFNLEKANDFLLKKNWTFVGADDNENSPTITWAYNLNEGNANAWLEQYQFGENEYIINYQISSKIVYERIKDRVNAFGMRLIKSQALNNVLSQIFQGKNYTISIDISTKNTELPNYHFCLMKNSSYELIDRINKKSETNR